MAGFADKRNITLLSSVFSQSEKIGREYLDGVDIDRLLSPIFEAHNMPAPNNAKRYGGWERKSANNWEKSPETFSLAGHSLGHFLSALSECYAKSGDEKLKQKILYIVSQLESVQSNAKSGYIGGCKENCFTELFDKNLTSWAEGYWVPWYNLHKIFKGLTDAYSVTEDQTVLRVLLRFADWACDGLSDFSDEDFEKMLEYEHGGMNEVFANLYRITKNEKYLYFAEKFTHKKLFRFLLKGEDKLDGWHANTQIPKVTGMAAIYAAAPEAHKEYRTAAENFWRFVTQDRSYAIGGNSDKEHFEKKGKETLSKKTCESCNTYNMMRLCEYLFSFEQKSEYFDWYENALLNHILAQQDESGAKMYFVSLLQGHHRTYEKKYKSWWCCTGTGMENPEKYENNIFFFDGSTLYINLYIPSRLETDGISLEINTDYPYSDKINIAVKRNTEIDSLKLRIPEFSHKAAAIRHGAKEFREIEKGYFTVSNIKGGDTVELTLPMEITEYKSREKDVCALKYGPVTLCAPLGKITDKVSEYISNELLIDDITVEYPSLLLNGKSAETCVEISDRKKLIFKIPAKNSTLGTPIILKPFFETRHEFYTVYFDKK
ncbi:MAG: glycoside hydrolase family 127 protein [Oscillospiraceae bacterium]|nr:glycoside hydrolase family 127 protein [Oscillospiraceae bacterium]